MKNYTEFNAVLLTTVMYFSIDQRVCAVCYHNRNVFYNKKTFPRVLRTVFCRVTLNTKCTNIMFNVNSNANSNCVNTQSETIVDRRDVGSVLIESNRSSLTLRSNSHNRAVQ